MDDLFTDAVRQRLADACPPDAVRAIEAGAPVDALWQTLSEAGFADALVPEAAGGAGLALAEVFGAMEQCGACALPVPLAETMVARALLAQAGVDGPEGGIVLAEPLQPAPEGGLACALARGAATARWVLARDAQGNAGWLLPLGTAQAQAAGFGPDRQLHWPAPAVATAARVPGLPALRAWQALVHAALMSGALQRVFDLTLQYANDRVQFGKPIGKFQAVQHQLSVMSEHVYAARMAARLAFDAAGLQPDPVRVAVAKARTSEAALAVAAASHSIHGAIGFTAEYDLQLLTRRLHQWRQTAGSESYWHDRLGEALLNGTDASLDWVRRATDLHA